jgi:hypothetical protein
MNWIRTTAVAALLVSLISLPASASADDQGRGRYRRQEVHARNEARREARLAAQQQYWDAASDYRYDSNRYRARRMSQSDRVYRGSDSQYYCRRDDGTTGLIIGATAGAVLGNIIAPGESKVIGTIIGGGAGALIGRAIDDGDMKCQ